MPSSTWQNDVAVRPTTPRFRIPPESPPGSSSVASNRSLECAPRAVAQLFKRKNAFHSFSGGRKLPGGVVLDVFVLANLGLPQCLALDTAFHIWTVVFERGAELFLLLNAMRTPPRPIHLDAALGQTARERVVLMLVAVVEIVGQSEHGHDNHHIGHNPLPIPVRRAYSQFFITPFSSLLRHGIFISRLLGVKPQTTTLNAAGSTSIAWHSSVNTSPSTITSTGASS